VTSSRSCAERLPELAKDTHRPLVVHADPNRMGP
jgi:hypothetical protein